MIYESEILDLDKRIKSTLIENPQDKKWSKNYCVKIWFDFKWINNGNRTSNRHRGRHEFIEESKEKILDGINKFLNEEHKTWEIIL